MLHVRGSENVCRLALGEPIAQQAGSAKGGLDPGLAELGRELCHRLAQAACSKQPDRVLRRCAADHAGEK